jgi:branched-chain amino acid transport system ATP-binding protein
MSALNVKDLHFAYGKVRVLHGISIDVQQGEIVALIGANGAGKSTLLNLVAGGLRARSGEVGLNGNVITRQTQRARVRNGLTLVPEGRQVFSSLTVEENLTLGAYSCRRSADVGAERLKVYTLFPRLEERSGQLAGTLSGGEQQMLAIGRALMARPSVLLLDEPSLGLAPKVVQLIMETLARLRDDGLTIVLVEQNAKAALRLADRAYLLETGTVRMSGPADEMVDDPQVVATYLGGSAT